MVHKKHLLLLKCHYFFIVLDCDPYSEETCRNVGDLLNLTFMKSSSYSTKGCYAYSKGKYSRNIYFGTGSGDRKTDLQSPKYRPVGSKKVCKALGVELGLTYEEDNWSTKGCYAYNNGKYPGMIYYSTKGTHAQNNADPGSGKFRPCPATEPTTTQTPATDSTTTQSCVPKSKKACEAAGKQLKKDFSSGPYGTKGCYAYNDGSYDGIYFGEGGDPTAKIESKIKYRPELKLDADQTTISPETDCI